MLILPASACTTFIVTPNASSDGSAYVGHTNDGLGAGVVGHHLSEEMTQMIYIPAADHPPGSIREVRYDPNSGTEFPDPEWGIPAVTVATIPEISHTFGYYTGAYAIMNEHQVMFGECTDLTRAEPSFDHTKRIFYSTELSNVAAERAKTAREAVDLMGDLIERYGYYGTGETLLVADPGDAWVMEMTGGTKDGTGGLWVAQRVPDGTIFVAANTFRIRDVEPNNPDMLYSKNLFATAKANGWWDPATGKLDWLRTVSDGEYSHPYYSLARIWSLYHRIAPSLNLSPYVHDTYSRDYPFSIKPDHPLTTPEVLALFRDHYEGTPFDLTTGVAAGPFGNPYRWRGEYDDHHRITRGEVKPGAWPRAVSDMLCGYSYIAQGRSWLPDPVGGVVWFGFAQPAETVYIPFYAGGTAVPDSFAATTRTAMNRDSAWCAFNFVTNWATLNYNLMIQDIRAEQRSIEERELAAQPGIEQHALDLLKAGNEAATRQYLTDYGMTNSAGVIASWWALSDRLMAKYSNHMVHDTATGNDAFTGYPGWWLEEADYQYGPRVYDFQELQEIPDLTYTNSTITSDPTREIETIRAGQQRPSPGAAPKEQNSILQLAEWFRMT